MVKIDKNYSIELSDNSLYKSVGRKKIKVIKFNDRNQLIHFTAKQMLLQSLDGQTVGIAEYTRVYETNLEIVKKLIQEDVVGKTNKTNTLR